MGINGVNDDAILGDCGSDCDWHHDDDNGKGVPRANSGITELLTTTLLPLLSREWSRTPLSLPDVIVFTVVETGEAMLIASPSGVGVTPS